LAGWFPCGLSSGSEVQVKKPVEVQLDGPTIRRMIATGLGTAATPKPASPIAPTPSTTKGAVGRALTSFGVAV
jgi:hypothetical protein